MDILTHGLASLALTRAFFPRANRMTVTVVVTAGTMANIDSLSSSIGPSLYLTAHRTFTHSILGTLVIAGLASAILRILLARKDSWKNSPPTIFAAPFCAAALHLLLDLCQSEGVALLWPFSARRFAADWLASVDLWILVILIAGIALPELFRLVGREIGAKDKGPRGRNGAIVALALILVYLGVRATLHSNAVALMEPCTFHGEVPRHLAAFPESASPVAWHGVVDTESSLHLLNVNVGPGGFFDPETGVTIHKPEASAILEAARATLAAQNLLRVARFPKASVEKTVAGYEVVLRDLRYAAAGEASHEVAVVVDLDPAGKVVSQEAVWALDLRHR